MYSTFHTALSPYIETPFWRHFWASGASYFIGTLLRAPLESIKCRQQLCTNKLLSTRDILTDLWHEKRLYKGSAMIAMRDTIPGALYFAVFFHYKRLLNNADNNVFPLIKKMLLGASMGVLYWIIAYPFDIIRNVQQSAKSLEKSKLLNAIKEIYHDFGLKGFYRGMGVTVTRTIFSSGISLSLLDSFLRIMNVDFDKTSKI